MLQTFSSLYQQLNERNFMSVFTLFLIHPYCFQSLKNTCFNMSLMKTSSWPTILAFYLPDYFYFDCCGYSLFYFHMHSYQKTKCKPIYSAFYQCFILLTLHLNQCIQSPKPMINWMKYNFSVFMIFLFSFFFTIYYDMPRCCFLCVHPVRYLLRFLDL